MSTSDSKDEHDTSHLAAPKTAASNDVDQTHIVVPSDNTTIDIPKDSADFPDDEPEQSLSEDSITKQERMELIKSFLSNREGLDCWQYAAFKLGTEWKNAIGVKERFRVLLSLRFPLFALFCQIVAIRSIIHHWHEVSVTSLFEFNPDIDYSEIVAVREPLMFGTFLVFIVVHALKVFTSMIKSGFYGALNYIPRVSRDTRDSDDESGISSKVKDYFFNIQSIPFIGDIFRIFVDYGVLYTPLMAIGFYVNLIIWYFCLWINLWILYIGDDPLELILNIIAVYFIVEMDDMLVPHGAYEEILKWFEEKENISQIRVKPMSRRIYIIYMMILIVLYVSAVLSFFSYFFIVIPVLLTLSVNKLARN